MKFTAVADGKTVNGVFVAKKTCVVTVSNAEGEVVDRVALAPTAVRLRQRLAAHGIEDRTLLALLDRAATGQTAEWTAPEAVAPAGFTATIRDIEAAEGETVAGLEAVLARVGTTPVSKLLCWTDETLGCLDIDYHGIVPPPRPHVEAWLESRLSPAPRAWHFSRSGGVHAFYTATDGISGHDLAACAALHYKTLDPTAGVELKRQIRGAGDEEVRLRAAQRLPDTLISWGGERVTVEADDVKDWLEARGMESGGRYHHSLCPIDPTEESSGDPVVVGELGVFCHRCSGKGLLLGGRKPGTASWGVLVGNTRESELSQLVKNLVHWGHARWVLIHKYGLTNEELAKCAYRAALTLAHKDDVRVSRVFNRDLDDLARSGDTWMNLNGGYVYQNNTVKPIIEALPCSLYVDDEGKTKTVATTTAYLLQGHDLASRGYGNIQVVHGVRLAEPHLPPPDATTVAIPNPKLAGTPFAPRYRTGMSTDKAEATIEQLFPGLDWNCVRTLLCAAGSAVETRLGMHPLIFIDGAAGSAKSSTCRVACGILGSATAEVQYNKDDEKLKQSIKEAAKRTSIVVANEFIKDSTRALRKFDPRAATETLLTLTPESSVWQLYVGPRRMGQVPAFVMTEPVCPRTLKSYTQVARRVRYIRLHGRKDSWKGTLAAAGINADIAHEFRMCGREYALAADVILADIIDSCFDTPTPWDVLADRYGAYTIEDHPEFDDVSADARRLFALICAAPELTDPQEQRHHAKGYKKIHRTDHHTALDTALATTYTLFAEGEAWGRSTLLEERDWNQVLGFTGKPIHLDFTTDPNNACIYLRFRTGPKKTPAQLNADIINLSQEIADVVTSKA